VPKYDMGSRTGAPRVLASDLEDRVVSLGDHPIMLRALVVGMREHGKG